MKDLIRSIVNIFRWVGRIISSIRVLTLNLAFLLLLIFIISAITSYSPKKETKVSASGALVLSLSGNIVEEKQPSDPISTVINKKLGFDTLPTKTLFQDILDAIENAAVDDNVVCILLDLRSLGSVGLNQLQTIGKALTNFKASGKKVIAAEDFYKQKAYYLASFADEIYLNPMGAVDLHGIGAYRLYFKDAIDKLKVNYNVFRVGTYKSALEPIMRNSMSAEAKAQNMAWLTALWDTITKDITRERKLSLDSIRSYTENIASELATAGGDTAKLALETGLVDGLKTREELRVFLADLAGKDQEGNFKKIKLNDYLSTFSRSFVSPPSSGGSIGIIIAEGAILTGKQPIGVIGGDSLSQLIRKARMNSNINALVLRIVSGGGSVFASEVIRQEILEYKKTGKPLVISMGAMAASGGYWIAADADKILASPATLTGSIGIFAAIPTFENTLSDLGIYSDGVGTTSLAAALDLSRPLSPLLKETIDISLHRGYEQFLDIVSNGRSISQNELTQLAEGRVFDGKKAMELGLVDELGDLKDAISSAANLAGLDSYSATYIRRPRTVKDEFLKMFSGRVSAWLASTTVSPSLLTAVGRLMAPIREIMLFNDPKGLYAQCLIHDLSL
ncbi:MAG TPA: signal peptide peptidase SppA [Desulfobacterales bacterium]|nr:signal peptide peptidase SppA [Desulfobacterales bacterium]